MRKYSFTKFAFNGIVIIIAKCYYHHRRRCYFYYYYHNYFYYYYVVIVSTQCVRGRVLVAGPTVLPHTRHQMTLLSYCPALFALKISAWSSTTNSSKFTGHVSPIHQYPHWVSKPIYDWPTCARDPIQIPHIWAARVGSRIKKTDTKAYSTYKSWIIFLGQTALNFPKAATKKSNDQQNQGNKRSIHPAAFSSLKRKYCW